MVRLIPRIALSLPGRRSARAYAISIVLAILTPALILAVVLAVRLARSERAHLEQSTQDQTREATAAIEREIIATKNVLLTLAGSPSLQSEDLRGFYGEAARVEHLANVTFLLRDAQSGDLLLNSQLPWGTPLADKARNPISEVQRETLRSGKPIVTGVFYGALLREFFVAVVVPVFRDGDLRFYLSAGIPVKRFNEILGSLNIRPNQIVNVVDGNGIFVTRSVKHDEYAGTHLADWIPVQMPSVVSGVGREGVAFHAFSRRSILLGWTVSTSMRDSVLNLPMYQAVWILAVGGTLLLFVAIALVHFLERRISQLIGTLGIDRQPTIEEFEILFNSAPNGVMVVDDRGRIVLLNARMERKFGYAHGELIGQPVEILVPERLRGAHRGLRETFARDPQSRPMGAGRDLYGQRKDGSEFPVEIGLNPIKSGSESMVMITVVDISARKLATKQLNATRSERDNLRRRFIQAQEQERLRLAHELHDQTGQNLTAVMLEIKNIEGAVDEQMRTRFRLLRLLLEQMGRTLHHVAWELRPASIDELGLSSALATYISEWGEKSGIATDFHCDEADRLSDEVCTVIYRVVQEALTNIVKHARGATSVSVVIKRVNAQLRVTVEDNGCGFDAAGLSESGATRSSGLGIAGMRERLTLIGAELVIESSIGSGTTIFARIPVESARAVA